MTPPDVTPAGARPTDAGAAGVTPGGVTPTVAAPDPVLEVDGLCVEFRTRGGTVRALDRVGLRLAAGETLALVGESGSGKSLTALSVLGLLPPGATVQGGVTLDGVNIPRAGPRTTSSGPPPA